MVFPRYISGRERKAGLYFINIAGQNVMSLNQEKVPMVRVEISNPVQELRYKIIGNISRKSEWLP